jgi:protein-disulfide isomerase
MSKANREKRARPAANLKKDRNWFPIITTAAVLVLVIVVAAVVFIGNTAANGPAKSPASASVNQETGAITIGTGATVIDEYIDLGCPACNAWFSKSSAATSDVVERGLATLNIHPISILDNQFQGTEYSTRAASATYCVADSNSDAAYAFITSLYENQPSEGTPGLTDDELAKFASDAGAPEAADCIANGEYKDFVTEKTTATPIQEGAGGISTPTIQVDGEFISPGSDPKDSIVAVAELQE